ncbi:hypothetical protein BV20DRAFT_1113892 [Pilatotrama ljubarskyi]|nr:hypothetical protein BV20DRAFT_1113892 [Pilatotrama ljubarskyi]
MSTNSIFKFPVPVGGAPLDIDFAPSIVSCVLYALLVPLALFRLISRRSRSTVLLGTTGFTIERVASYAFRTYAARNDGARESPGLETYLQTALSSGYITIGQDLLNLLRALLVNSTVGSAPSRSSASGTTPMYVFKATSQEADRNGEDGYQGSSAGLLEESERGDQPRHRHWIRQVCGIASLVFLGAIVVNVIGVVGFKDAMKTGEHSVLVQQMRYASAAIVLLLLDAISWGAFYALLCLPRVPKKPAIFIVVVSLLLSAVGHYRLVVMAHWTTSLTSMAPGAQNARKDKIFFYLFHVAPEWLAVALLMTVNAREMFRTGLCGDIRMSDRRGGRAVN